MDANRMIEFIGDLDVFIAELLAADQEELDINMVHGFCRAYHSAKLYESAKDLIDSKEDAEKDRDALAIELAAAKTALQNREHGKDKIPFPFVDGYRRRYKLVNNYSSVEIDLDPMDLAEAAGIILDEMEVLRQLSQGGAAAPAQAEPSKAPPSAVNRPLPTWMRPKCKAAGMANAYSASEDEVREFYDFAKANGLFNKS